MIKDKESANPEIKQFITFAFDTYKEKFEEKLYVNGRDAKTVQRLLETFDVKKLEKLWEKFLDIADTDKFILDAGCTIPVFESCINKLISGSRRKRSGIMDAVMDIGDTYDEDRSEENNIIPFRRISKG